jgi:hypothetical protein
VLLLNVCVRYDSFTLQLISFTLVNILCEYLEDCWLYAVISHVFYLTAFESFVPMEIIFIIYT